MVINVINERFAMIADGDLRKIENPKIKNLKHIKITNIIADDVKACLAKGEMPDNHIIRENPEEDTRGWNFGWEGGLVNG